MMEFNLNEEVRDGYLVPSELKKIWSVELDLMKVFLEVCSKHGLRCWVDGGTLLGAVRHHGFIPWDDDIDIAMPRDDYDRLLRLDASEFKPPYFLQSAYSDIDYYRGHAQLRNSDTAGIRPTDCFQPFNQGIFIDIFVLDGVCEDVSRRKAMIRKSKKIRKLLRAKNTSILYSGRLGLFFRKLKSRYEVKRRGWQAIYRESEDILRSVSLDSCERWALISLTGDDILYDKHIYDETVYLDFEDMKVPAPKGYDLYLRTQYGDTYMTPQRDPTYHGSIVFDTEHSYREILPKVQKDYRHSAMARLKKKLMK